MSVGDHEIEEPDEWPVRWHCQIHGTVLSGRYGVCQHCADDEADRRHDEQVKARGGR